MHNKKVQTGIAQLEFSDFMVSDLTPPIVLSRSAPDSAFALSGFL